MKSKIVRFISAIILLAVAVPILSLQVFAAKTVTPISGCVSVTDSNNTGSLSNGTVTITASGWWSSKTNTVTITNESSSIPIKCTLHTTMTARQRL